MSTVFCHTDRVFKKNNFSKFKPLTSIANRRSAHLRKRSECTHTSIRPFSEQPVLVRERLQKLKLLWKNTIFPEHPVYVCMHMYTA